MVVYYWFKSSRRGTDVSPFCVFSRSPTSGLLVLVEEVDDFLGCLEQYLHYFHSYDFKDYPTELLTRTGLRVYTSFYFLSTSLKVVRPGATQRFVEMRMISTMAGIATTRIFTALSIPSSVVFFSLTVVFPYSSFETL